MPSINTLRNGIPVGFDPDTGKWFAEVDGKRTTSQSFDALANRLDTQKKSVSKAHVENFEVTTLALGIDKINQPTPVRLQLAWNSKKGQAEIKKYKLLTPGNGWKEFQSEDLLVANPSALPGPFKAITQEKLFNGVLSDAYAQTEKAFALAWLALKSSSTAVYLYQTVRTPGLNKGGQKELDFSKRTSDSRNLFTLLEGAPLEVLAHEEGVHTKPIWAVTPEGYWEHDSKELRVRLDVGHSIPYFKVEERKGESFVEVFSGQNFNEALKIAELTHHFKAEEAAAAWSTSDLNIVKDSVSWPIPTHVRGYAFIAKEDLQASLPKGEVVLYTLTRSEHNPLSTHGSDDPHWKWSKREGNSHAGTYNMPKFLAPGAEDAGLSALLALRQELLSIQREQLKIHVVVAQLKTSRQEWLDSLYEANLNGEWEDPTPEALRAQWERQNTAWLANATKDPTVVAFREKSQALTAEAETLLSPPAPKARGPKPGR